MTKKNYIKAAEIVQTYRLSNTDSIDRIVASKLENAFVNLFTGDNPQFDERRFRDACKV